MNSSTFGPPVHATGPQQLAVPVVSNDVFSESQQLGHIGPEPQQLAAYKRAHSSAHLPKRCAEGVPYGEIRGTKPRSAASKRRQQARPGKRMRNARRLARKAAAVAAQLPGTRVFCLMLDGSFSLLRLSAA